MTLAQFPIFPLDSIAEPCLSLIDFAELAKLHGLSGDDSACGEILCVSEFGHST